MTSIMRCEMTPANVLSASLSLLLETGIEIVEAALFERIDYLRLRIEQHPEPAPLSTCEWRLPFNGLILAYSRGNGN